MKGEALQDDRIYRVNPPSETLTCWLVGKDDYSEGLALVASGNFWWADAEVGLARLDPAAGR